MVKKYLIDSNILIDVLKKDSQIDKNKFVDAFKKGEPMLLSVVSHYEIMRGFESRWQPVPKIKKNYLDFLAISEIKIINLSPKTYDLASKIYGQLQKEGCQISELDVLIAAQAIHRKLIVVTNDGDFLRIKDLKVENWSFKT